MTLLCTSLRRGDGGIYRDSNFKWRSVDKVAEAARRIYALYGTAGTASELLRVEHPDCDHDFPPEMRELAYELFERHLLDSRGRL